jgi:O-antigen/teichoic acid export membrane protein
VTVTPTLAAPTGTSRRNLVRAFSTSAAGAVVTYAVNLAIVPFVLHRIGAGLYGAWATMASILAVGALADAGVRTEIIRRVGSAQGEGDDAALVRAVHQGVTLLVGFAAVITVVGGLAAPAIRSFAFPGGVVGYSPAEVDLLLRATVAVLGASLVASGYFGVLRGVQRGDVEAAGQMLAVPVSAAVTVLGVALGWGLWALFLGSVVTLVVSAGWNSQKVHRLVPGLRLRLVALEPRLVKGYLAFSALALLSQVSDVVDSQWDKVVLSHFVGSSAVASFQIGTSLVLQGKALALLPLVPLLVAIAELRGRDAARMEKLFHLMARAGMVLGAVVLGGLFVFAPAFVRLWLGSGPAATGAANAARLFTFAVALNLVSAPLAFRAFGEGWHTLAAAGSVANMVVNGALSLALTMAIGFNGALYGSIAGNLAGTALFFVLMRRRMGDRWAPPPWRALAVGTVGAAVAVLAGAPRVTSWPALIAAGTVYLGAVGSACAWVEHVPVGQLLSRPRAEVIG